MLPIRNKRFYSFIFFLLFAVVAKAQFTESVITIGGLQGSTIVDMVDDGDKHLFVTSINYINEGQLSKIDTLGNIIWQRSAPGIESDPIINNLYRDDESGRVVYQTESQIVIHYDNGSQKIIDVSFAVQDWELIGLFKGQLFIARKGVELFKMDIETKEVSSVLTNFCGDCDDARIISQVHQDGVFVYIGTIPKHSNDDLTQSYFYFFDFDLNLLEATSSGVSHYTGPQFVPLYTYFGNELVAVTEGTSLGCLTLFDADFSGIIQENLWGFGERLNNLCYGSLGFGSDTRFEVPKRFNPIEISPGYIVYFNFFYDLNTLEVVPMAEEYNIGSEFQKKYVTTIHGTNAVYGHDGSDLMKARFHDIVPPIDEDGDGFLIQVDCDDNNELINPDAIEILNNDIDENCDGLVEIDEDGDGFLLEEDCNDNDASVHPDAVEVFNNGLDDDCNPATYDSLDYCIVPGEHFNSTEELIFFHEQYQGCNLIVEGSLIFDNNAEYNYSLISNVHVVLENLHVESYMQNQILDLPNLTYVGGYVEVDRQWFGQIKLENLQYAGSLEFRRNDYLTSLSIYNDIEIENDFDIRYNENLNACCIPAIINNPQIKLGLNGPECSNYEDIVNSCIDDDGDGYSINTDCDDNNPLVNEGAIEILNNGVDDDCNPYTNDSLETCFLENLLFKTQDHIDSFYVEYNYCNVVVRNLSIRPDSLKSLDLSKIDKIVGVIETLAIKNLENNDVSLANLTFVGESMYVQYCNMELLSLSNLVGNINSIVIQLNPNLRELNLGTVTITSHMTINNNPSLAMCDIEPICIGLKDLKGAWDISLYGNAPGCENDGEVRVACGDMDGDGYIYPDDCDEDDASINIDTYDIPENGIDENCDGKDRQQTVLICKGDIYNNIEVYSDTVFTEIVLDDTFFYEVFIVELIEDIYLSKCPGEILTIDTLAFANPGDFTFIKTNESGCDSIFNIFVRDDKVVSIDICESLGCGTDTIFIEDQFYTEPGQYRLDKFSDTDCDTTYFIIIDEIENNLTQIDTSLTYCFGDSLIAFRDSIYDISGFSSSIDSPFSEAILYQTDLGSCDTIFSISLLSLTAYRYITVCDGDYFSNEHFDSLQIQNDTTIVIDNCPDSAFVYTFYNDCSYNILVMATRVNVLDEDRLLIAQPNNMFTLLHSGNTVWTTTIEPDINLEENLRYPRLNDGIVYYLRQEDNRVVLYQLNNNNGQSIRISDFDRPSADKVHFWTNGVDHTIVTANFVYVDNGKFSVDVNWENLVNGQVKEYLACEIYSTDPTFSLLLGEAGNFVLDCSSDQDEDRLILYPNGNGLGVLFQEGLEDSDFRVHDDVQVHISKNAELELKKLRYSDFESIEDIYLFEDILNQDPHDYDNFISNVEKVEIFNNLIIADNVHVIELDTLNQIGKLSCSDLDEILETDITPLGDVIFRGVMNDAEKIIKKKWDVDLSMVIDSIQYGETYDNVLITSDTSFYSLVQFEVGEFKRLFNIKVIYVDEDGDGFTNEVDCDDTNPEINPNIIEIPNNGIDEDCDGSDLTTSSTEIGENQLNIYPNPATDKIYLDNQTQQLIEIQVYNLLGVKVMEFEASVGENEVDVSSLRSGVYFIANTSVGIIERVVVE